MSYIQLDNAWTKVCTTNAGQQLCRETLARIGTKPVTRDEIIQQMNDFCTNVEQNVPMAQLLAQGEGEIARISEILYNTKTAIQRLDDMLVLLVAAGCIKKI